MKKRAVEQKRRQSVKGSHSKKASKGRVADLIRNKAVVTVKEVLAEKISRNTLANLAKKGELVRLKPGVYESIYRDISENESLVDVSAQAPKAIITLLSALQFHGLTTQNPNHVWIAFPRGQRVPKITYPPIRHFIFSDKPYVYGAEKHEVQGVTIQVYSIAKTIADCFKYRNKIGLDVALEALKEGLRENKATRDEIWNAAKICRVQNIIRPYMESL